ncbi:MAG: imelysin family protein [Campylobacterota bacterium]|nr:imelysin family protein [Campylobacterota bacterium]
MMKYILHVMIAALFFIGCVDDNAYDGESGLISGGTSSGTTAWLQQINDEVLVTNASLLRDQATMVNSAIVTLTQEQSRSNLNEARQLATTLFENWKALEAIYVAKKLDDVMIDIPAQIDVFNIGNIDIPERLDAIFSGSSSLSGQLYQSATRSMGALEYTLFGNQEFDDLNMTQRRADSAMIMANYLQGHINTIADFYENGSEFVDAGEDAVGIMINQLIDSTYKLKEWRIGDPAGYTVKYKDDPDAERLEYFHSLRSLEGMHAILNAQLAVMQNGLGEIAAANSAASEGDALVVLLQDAMTQIDAFDTAIEDGPSSAQVRELYNSVATIQTSYTALINALNFQQDIIEADGD